MLSSGCDFFGEEMNLKYLGFRDARGDWEDFERMDEGRLRVEFNDLVDAADSETLLGARRRLRFDGLCRFIASRWTTGTLPGDESEDDGGRDKPSFWGEGKPRWSPPH